MIAFAALLLSSTAAMPDVSEIMRRVAENQDKAVEFRRQWSYQQLVRVRLDRGNGKLARLEEREYFVTPGSEKVERQLQKVTGRIEDGGTRIDYTDPKFRRKDPDIDGEIVEEFSDDVMGGKGGRDGIAPEMFPLIAKEQAKYRFKLLGKSMYQERPVYRVEFKPIDNSAMWAGEAFIDTHELQPVLITTRLARRVPIAIRLLFGVSVQNLGFKVTYKRVEDGVWFPATYGGEFKLRVLFLYSRKIVTGLRNDDFRKTHVASNITYEVYQ